MPDVIWRRGPWEGGQVMRVELRIIIRALILLMDLRDPVLLLPCKHTVSNLQAGKGPDDRGLEIST